MDPQQRDNEDRIVSVSMLEILIGTNDLKCTGYAATYLNLKLSMLKASQKKFEKY